MRSRPWPSSPTPAAISALCDAAGTTTGGTGLQQRPDAHRSGDPTFGYVRVLGVRRPWRRRGLGLALLRHAFHDFRHRGMTRAGLDVDAENLTGAVRLYERAGMRIVKRRDVYEKVL